MNMVPYPLSHMGDVFLHSENCLDSKKTVSFPSLIFIVFLFDLVKNGNIVTSRSPQVHRNHFIIYESMLIECVYNLILVVYPLFLKILFLSLAPDQSYPRIYM